MLTHEQPSEEDDFIGPAPIQQRNLSKLEEVQENPVNSYQFYLEQGKQAP